MAEAKHIEHHDGERVETGPVQFGDYWPGVFIRGDDAAGYTLPLKQALVALEAAGLMRLEWACLRGLLSDLESCRVRHGNAETAPEGPLSPEDARIFERHL